MKWVKIKVILYNNWIWSSILKIPSAIIRSTGGDYYFQLQLTELLLINFINFEENTFNWSHYIECNEAKMSTILFKRWMVILPQYWLASFGFNHRFSVSVFLVFHCPILSLTCYKINEKTSSATESLLKNPECLIYIIERLLFVYVALICGLVLLYPYHFTLVK